MVECRALPRFEFGVRSLELVVGLVVWGSGFGLEFEGWVGEGESCSLLLDSGN